MYEKDGKVIKIDLDDFKKQFEHEVKYLNEYFELNNSMLTRKKKELDLCLKKDIIENPEFEKHLKYFYKIDFIKIPCYFYHSAIVSLYSLLENNIKYLCETIQTQTNYVIELRDLAGFSVVEKGRLYLNKIADINFEKVNREWEQIKKLQKLRNLIVHNNAQTRSHEKDNKLLNEFKVIKIIEKDFFITDVSLVYYFLKLIETFLNDISKQIEEKEFKMFSSATKPIRCKYLDELPF